MKLIVRDDIELWSKRYDSKGDFPILISRLIRATTPQSTEVDIPSGSTVNVGGWDGIVKCYKNTHFIPKGISLLEFGTENNHKGKANDDYDKRISDPLGYNSSECTFIFITSKFWRNKDKWRNEKLKNGKWKDILVYDSSNIEQWLNIAQPVSRWFSAQISKYPFDGIQTADEFWEEWSVGPIVLLPEVVTSGREIELTIILDFLSASPNIKTVRASTKSEAVAFIIASAKQFKKNESERFFSKTMIVDSEGNFRGIRINNTASQLNLIPKFDDTQPLYAAVSQGHHILVPLGADDDFNQDIINLPRIDGRGQISSLVESGLSKENAEKFSKEAGRNITILKKLIGFPAYKKANWIKNESIREIIPVLLIGRWDESFRGDIEIIEKLTGISYDEYSVILSKWLKVEESPLIQIGETWRLTSPLDVWTNLTPHLTNSDFKKLSEIFSYVFKSGNPTIEPDNNKIPSLYFIEKKNFSDWIREGLTQSLILIGFYGEELRFPKMTSPQSWVDNLVHSILYKASGNLWISFDHELPLIAEASPKSFLNAVYESLSQEQPVIMKMFKKIEGLSFPNSNHTGLLWALEGLAWMPEYLHDASLMLLKLSRLDPGGNLANRPINSITEIFKPWYYQTLATFDERMSILKRIVKEEPEIGWNLLLRMLPEHQGSAHPTHKMRWRMFDKNTNLKYTYQEIWDTYLIVVSLLTELFDYNEQKFAQLIEKSDTLSPNDRNKVLDWANSIYSKVEQKKYLTWHAIRKTLHHHRSYPKTDWALPEEELKKYEVLYSRLKPTDTLNQYIWLFNDNRLELPEGFAYDDNNYVKQYKKHQKKIDNVRIKGLNNIINEYGIKEITNIYKTVKERWIFGVTLAEIISDEKEILTISQSLYDDEEHIHFIFGFFYEKSISEGFEWIKSQFLKLSESDFSKKALANLLIPLNQNNQLWQFIDSQDKEVQKEYWLKVRPDFFHATKKEKIIGLRKLLGYKRYYSAIDICSYFAADIPTDLLIEILYKAATKRSNETIQFSIYEIERIYETIYKRDDIKNDQLINLEWLYLPILASYGTRRSPKILYDELSNNPEFFVQVLKWIYLLKNKEKANKGEEGLSEEIIQNRAKQAYKLLCSWKKIPGIKEDNTINSEKLEEWIDKVRKLAKDEDKLEVADMHIGQVLAQYPENILEWPNEIIFKIIESINSNSMKINYYSAMFDKRGSSTRGVYDGGDIERGYAEYFRKLAEEYRLKYPNVSNIFRKLTSTYLIDAKRMDEEAERNKLEY